MQPSEQLAGITVTGELMGRWEVTERVGRLPTDTGGGQSASYWVEHESGQLGFLKAIDFMRAFRQVDHASAIKFLSDAYVFERDLCLRCGNKKLKRIVHAIDHGTVIVDPSNPVADFLKVSFLIFARADSDIRRYIATSQAFDHAVALRTLHNITTALAQFHRAGFAHQDLKPSNVLVFRESKGNISKLADLGRAWAKDMPSPFDAMKVAAGDPNYAPIEYQYGAQPANEAHRRYGCDLYLLGNMIVFLFSRTSIHALINKHLAPMHRSIFSGTNYSAVLPHLQAAFGLALEDFGRDLPGYLKTDLVGMVAKLCEPDFTRRGYSFGSAGETRGHDLSWFVSRFDNLTRRAQVRLSV